jgi:two-component system, NarL family, nitrate/nitrite response regulator NarL
MSSRVLIVDDHPMIRSAVAMLLDGSDFTIAASAGSVDSALQAIRDEDPDMIILDLAMPGESGLEVLRRMRAGGDRRPVIVLTAAIDDFSLREAMSLAVDGIVMKNNDPAFLLDCLQSVRDGGRWIDPDLEQRAAELGKRGPYRALSPRERKLVALVARGLRNREIAAELGITEGTVKVYLHAIFDKLGVASRTELAIRAGEDGLRF